MVRRPIRPAAPSPARKSPRPRSASPMRTPPPRKAGGGRPAPRTRRGSSVRILVISAVLIVAFAFLAPYVRAYVEQSRAIGALEQDVAARHDRLSGLERTRSAWNDPAYVRQQARERLHYVMPGQSGFVVLDDTGRAAEDGSGRTADGAEGPAPAAPSAAPTPWFDSLWASVAKAGRSRPAQASTPAPSTIPTPAPERTTAP